MTVLMEASPTTAVAEQPIQQPDVERMTSWVAAAFRAHALLSQTMPDEELDDLVVAATPSDQAIVLPSFLFG
jgi:hypothetical protein